MTDEVKVEVRRGGRSVEAQAMLDLDADAQTSRDAITDDDALARHMPASTLATSANAARGAAATGTRSSGSAGSSAS